jgi:purine-nucleoside/S-methyl-5'-thioadenosine phosphorylase / adenosine deaminase
MTEVGGLFDPRADVLALPGARAVFTTRRGGVSEGPYESLNVGLLTEDDAHNVRTNRHRVADAAGVDAHDVALAMQVHGTEILEWDGPTPGDAFAEPGAAELPKADGHLTRRAGLGLLVFVADCYPVALSDSRQAAMLHCGWRPLAAGILERAIARFDGTPAAAVGPGIGGCCYEVGPEVLDAFADLEGVAGGRMLDLRAVIARKLANAGVTDVQHLDRCTSCDAERYFSHRRDKGTTGRQAGLVVLDG